MRLGTQTPATDEKAECLSFGFLFLGSFFSPDARLELLFTSDEDRTGIADGCVMPMLLPLLLLATLSGTNDTEVGTAKACECIESPNDGSYPEDEAEA